MIESIEILKSCERVVPIQPVERLTKRAMRAVPKRPAAPPVATRQSKRNLLFRAAFDTFTRTYPGEGRARRRAMARAWAKNRWRAMVAA